jgi:2-methylcitrate dehydratase PrpD
MEACNAARGQDALGVKRATALDVRLSSVAEHLASFVHGTTLDGVPSAVVERAKYVLLDTIGIMLAAAGAPEMCAFRESVADTRAGYSTAFGANSKTSATAAALANGSLTTVLQFDEGHRESMGHPAIHIVPAVLAVGEELNRSGNECLTALIVGYEVAVRIGRSAFPLRSQLHPHGNWATVGAAVAVGKLLDFSRDQLTCLIDCAAMMSLFSWRRATVGGATIHHLLPGLAAHNAIVAAYAVRSGLSGPASSLDEFLLPLVSERPSPALLDADLGTRWEILENYFKPFPACAHAHSAIAAMRNLLTRHRIDAGDIVRISVATYPIAATLQDQAPRNQLAGMFSIPYNLGLLVTEGKLDSAALLPQMPLRQAALDIAKRVHVRADASLAPVYPRGRPCRLDVELNDGTILGEFVPVPPALAAPDFLLATLRDKFLDLATNTISHQQAVRLLHALLDIEHEGSVRLLFH